MAHIINVRTVTQAALFNLELRGQLSDGYWENTRPHDHWKVWCDAEAVVLLDSTGKVGRNFWAGKDNYNFAAPSLLSVVSGRMIGLARIARNISLDCAQLLHDWCLIECDGTIDWTVTETGPYWDQKRERLSRLDRAAIDAALQDTSYGIKQLRKDLRDLGAIIRVDVRKS